MTNSNKMLNPAEAAEFLGISKVSLARLRAAETGPAYFKPSPGIVRYSLEDLQAWMLSHRVEG